MKKALIILLLFVTSLGQAQYTLIPDPFFENYLIIAGIDSDGIINGQVLTSDIDDETELIFLYNQITDLTGIEDFISLEHLNITGLNILEIDLSNQTNLLRFDLADVSLINLDLSNNVALEEFYLSINFASSQFTSPMSNIDLSSNIALKHLNMDHSFINSVSISDNVSMDTMELRHMDYLTYVNLKNGNNLNLAWLQLVDNPNLQCVQVDDPASVIAGVDPPYNNWTIENNPVITDDCSLGITTFDLENTFSIHPNPTQNHIYIENHGQEVIQSIRLYDAAGRLVLEEKGDVGEIDISRMESGLFFLKIKTEEGVITKKLIKE